MTSAELMQILFSGSENKIKEVIKDRSFVEFCNRPLSSGQYPIHAAAIRKNVKAVAMLLEAGVNPNIESEEPGDTLGSTAAHYAAAVNCVSVLRVLKRHGADLDHPAADQWTPLHAATFRGKSAAFEELLQLGVNVNCTTSAGYTPLLFAVNLGRVKEVRYLLRSKAKIHLKDSRHDSLLHYALHYRLSQAIGAEYELPDSQLDVAVLLVLNGARPDELNEERHTPTRYAEAKLPSLPKVLHLLFSNAIKLLCAPIEINYLTLTTATVDFLVEKVGLEAAQAQALVEAMATLEKERKLIPRKHAIAVDSVVSAEASCFLKAVCPPKPPGTHKSGGEVPYKGVCPFFQRLATHSNTHRGEEGEDRTPRLSKLYTLCYLKNTLLLIGTAFLLGYFCGQCRRG